MPASQIIKTLEILDIHSLCTPAGASISGQTQISAGIRCIAQGLARVIAYSSAGNNATNINIIDGQGLVENCFGILSIAPGAGAITTLDNPIVRRLMIYEIPFSLCFSLLADKGKPSWCLIQLSSTGSDDTPALTRSIIEHIPDLAIALDDDANLYPVVRSNGECYDLRTFDWANVSPKFDIILRVSAQASPEKLQRLLSVLIEISCVAAADILLDE